MTPAQTIALARVQQLAAEVALLAHHGITWNVENGLMTSHDSDDALLLRFQGPEFVRLAKELAYYFSKNELTAMAQPVDPNKGSPVKP